MDNSTPELKLFTVLSRNVKHNDVKLCLFLISQFINFIIIIIKEVLMIYVSGDKIYLKTFTKGSTIIFICLIFLIL